MGSAEGFARIQIEKGNGDGAVIAYLMPENLVGTCLVLPPTWTNPDSYTLRARLPGWMIHRVDYLPLYA